MKNFEQPWDPSPLRSPGWRRINGTPLNPWMVTIFCLIHLSLSLTTFSFSISLLHIVLLNNISTIYFVIWPCLTLIQAEVFLGKWILSTWSLNFLAMLWLTILKMFIFVWRNQRTLKDRLLVYCRSISISHKEKNSWKEYLRLFNWSIVCIF